MAVLTLMSAAAVDAPAPAAEASAPACSLQRVAPQSAPGKSPSLWQLGIEAQELTRQIGALAELLDSEESDIQAEAVRGIEAVLAAEANNRQAIEAKADATCWVIGNLRAQAEYRKHQAKRLAELGTRDAKRAAQLEAVLFTVLTLLQPSATRFSLPHHELTSRRGTVVDLDAHLEKDSDQPLDLPLELQRVKTSYAANKKLIEAAIKGGMEIDGARLVERRSWRIG